MKYNNKRVRDIKAKRAPDAVLERYKLVVDHQRALLRNSRKEMGVMQKYINRMYTIIKSGKLVEECLRGEIVRLRILTVGALITAALGVAAHLILG